MTELCDSCRSRADDPRASEPGETANEVMAHLDLRRTRRNREAWEWEAKAQAQAVWVVLRSEATRSFPCVCTTKVISLS